MLLRNIPKTDDKGCIARALPNIPVGSRLLRTEERGGSFLCVFGIYRSPEEFTNVAKQLWHPFDELRNLPDELITFTGHQKANHNAERVDDQSQGTARVGD